jgi:hypothetical protein
MRTVSLCLSLFFLPILADDDSLITLLDGGTRLQLPMGCSDVFKMLIADCWLRSPTLRPVCHSDVAFIDSLKTMEKVVERLGQMPSVVEDLGALFFLSFS